MAEVTMPRLSDTMTEGTISRWMKKPGDQVEKGDVLAEIETDKATMELEAYERGTLQQILVQEGNVVPIGQTIALIGEGAASAEGTKAAAAAQQDASTSPPSAQEPSGDAPPSAPTISPSAAADERVKASPLARRVAEEYGVDLHQVEGSGPGGRIIRENVETFYQQHGTGTPAPSAAPSAAPSTTVAAPSTMAAPTSVLTGPPPPSGSTPTPLNRMRQAIAKRMTEAKHGMPHIYITSEIDMGEALTLRSQIMHNNGAAHMIRISVNDMVIKAVAKALREYPAINSSFVIDEDGQPGIVEHEHVNMSVAVAVDDGLIVPVVRDADKKSIGTIAEEVKDLAIRAREGQIKQHELEGGTFTISNLGMFDVTSFSAVITPPQAGVLAVSSIRQVPIVRDAGIVIADLMNVTLSVDHRVTDGAVAAKFLREIKHLMQSPLRLLV